MVFFLAYDVFKHPPCFAIATFKRFCDDLAVQHQRIVFCFMIQLQEVICIISNLGQRIRIEVSNGNGVNRMARKVGDFLKGDGVILMYLSNARHFKHEETKIYYTRGYLREAYQLAQKLVGRQSLEEVPAVRGGKAEISILIGKDLVPHLRLFQTS